MSTPPVSRGSSAASTHNTPEMPSSGNIFITPEYTHKLLLPLLSVPHPILWNGDGIAAENNFFVILLQTRPVM